MICNKNIIYIFVYKAIFNSDNPPLFRCMHVILMRVYTIYVKPIKMPFQNEIPAENEAN